MESATPHRRAAIDVVLALSLALCAGCTGNHGATSQSTSAATTSPVTAATLPTTPPIPNSGGGAGNGATATSSPTGQQLLLLTQEGIDEDIGYVTGPTTFYDCERGAGIGLLHPHSLTPVGYNGCRAGAMLAEYAKKQLGASASRSDFTTLVKVGLSKSPDSAVEIRSIIGTSRSIDLHQAALIATQMRAIASGSESSTASGGH